jgi:predicted DNA helicase
LNYRSEKELFVTLDLVESGRELKESFKLERLSWRVDQGFSTITFNRVDSALKSLKSMALKSCPGPLQIVMASYLSQLRNSDHKEEMKLLSFKHRDPRLEIEALGIDKTIRTLRLNPPQEKAVRQCFESRISLIHGPPGTGKTVTAASLIFVLKTLLDRMTGKIGVFAFNNVATDHLMSKCLDLGIKCIRIGNLSAFSDPRFPDCDLSLIVKKTAAKEFAKLKEIELGLAKCSRSFKEINTKLTKLYNEKKAPLSMKKLASINRQIMELNSDKDDVKEDMGNLLKQKKAVRRKIDEAKVEAIKGAEAVFTTCVRGGHPDLASITFACVVIDECTQAFEPSCMIPLLKLSEEVANATHLRSCRLVLLGDHKQLPPMVRAMRNQKEIREFSESKGKIPMPQTLKLSMFERLLLLVPLVNNPALISSTLLKIQYRMHPKISLWPNEKFYGSELQNGCSEKERKLPFSTKDLFSFDASFSDSSDFPVFFVNVGEKALEVKVNTSWANPHTCRLVKLLVHSVKLLAAAELKPRDIGVITPYSAQRKLLMSREQASDADFVLPRDIEVKTVDGFQGREKEIIIIDTVRCNSEENIGFLDDERRLNVAITRAKRLVIIVGSLKTLSSNPTWRSLIEHLVIYKRIVQAIVP